MEPIITSIIFVSLIALFSLPGYLFRRRIYVNGKEVTIKNNPLGIESVFVDNQKIASKFSLSGGIYTCDVDGAKIEIDYFYRLCGLSIGITVRKDGSILYSDK